MRSHFQGRCFAAPLAVILLLSGVAGPLRVAPVAATSGGPYDAGATELERILNIERVQAGLPALPIDTFLAAKARDGAVACLADPSLVMEGRAKDLAVNGWVGPSPHYLRLCPTESITDAMDAWGYTGPRGEIIAWNGGYGTDPGWYRSDCGAPGYPACEFLTYLTVSIAATGFMEEPGHKAVVLGDYDRFACGAWIAPDGSAEPGAYYYDCMFAKSGPNPTAGPPTAAPTFPPRAPTHVEAVATEDGAVLISWDASVGVIDSPISAYTVTSSPDGRTCVTTGALACPVTGLTAGTPYTFTVTATNGDGTGPPSAASNTVVLSTAHRLDHATYLDLSGYLNDRYGTDAAVAEQAFGSGASVVYVASGANFPDALGAGAAAAGAAGGPVLLVTPTSIPAAIAHELTALHPTTIYVVGSGASVSDAVLTALGGYATP